MTDFDEYERDYLHRVDISKKNRSNTKKPTFQWDPLLPLDYMILGLMRNGIFKVQTMFSRLQKVSSMKITKRLNEMEKRGLLQGDKKESWLTRQFNPTVTLTDKGKEEIEKKIGDLREEWDKLVVLYEKKDKEKLREGMNSNRMNFPLMMMMGFASGMMMGNMLGMNQMMMGDFMAEVDYAYDMGYADGAGFGDGAMPAESGDFGGDGGGFMDGGMGVGF